MPKTKLEKILRERKEKEAALNNIDMQAQMMKDAYQQEMQTSQEFAGMQDQASAMMAQALQEAQETSHGADTKRNDVSNNVQLAA